MGDYFIIRCPWCHQKSSYTVKWAKACIRQDDLAKKVDQLLADAEASGRLFGCQNKECWAPFEALVCGSSEIVKGILQSLYGATWFWPRQFRLRKDVEGATYPNRFGVLFNRKPLKRSIHIHLSKLVDVDMVAKFLLGVVGDRVHPVTLFEAWPTDQKIFWLPVEARSPKKSRLYERVLFRPTCSACRKVFEPEAIRALSNDNRTGKNCPFFHECPAHCVCMDTENHHSHISDRCLLWLEHQEKYSPCYNSDLEIIRQVAANFVAGKAASLSRNCWAGYQEIAFPVTVHEHLVGIVMTGQFPTDEAPHTPSEFLAKEREWRSSHADMSNEAILPKHEDEIKDAIHGVLESDSPKSGVLAGQDLHAALREDVNQLTLLAEDRYLHGRYLSESAFRHELSGTLTNALLSGNDLADVLQPILDRMRSFWAFERVCLLMGTDSEEHVKLCASDKHYLATEESQMIQHDIGREFGTRGIYLVFEASTPLKGYFAAWKRFLAGIGKQYPELAPQRFQQVFVAVVRAGNRIYIFNFYDRDVVGISRLPFRSNSATGGGNRLSETRLSEECREQVLRTCQNVAERLHQFWAAHDQEQMYRVLSHTLRSPVAQMRRGSGKLRHRLKQDGSHIQPTYPEFYSCLQELLNSLNLGAKVVNGELTKLGAVGNLAEILRKAKTGECDICDVLRGVYREYEWRGSTKAAGTRAVVWKFAVPAEEHRVVGEAEVVELAVRNVIDNAFKYSYPGRCINIALQIAEHTCVVIVRNQGVPIEPGEEERVWQKNYRGINVLKRLVKGEEGTGFGLYLVRMILRAPGGDAFLECKPVSSVPRPEGEITVQLRFRGASK